MIKTCLPYFLRKYQNILECCHVILHIYYGCLTDCETDMDCSEVITSEEYVDYIVEYNGDINSLREYYADNCLNFINTRYAIAYRRKPDDYMEIFSRLAYNLFPKLYGLMDTSSMETTGVINVQRENILGLTGRNTIIGIVDTGIDISSSLFRTSTGETRILAAWDQSAEYTGTARYNYGREYSKEEIQAAIENGERILRDNTGHGTFLTGIAAGGRSDEFTGAAPEAALVVVKLKEAKQNIRSLYGVPNDVEAYAENDIMLGIAYIMQIVYQYKAQVSILIGLGTNSGSHSSSSALESYINTLGILPGIAISVGAGNEGVAGHHFAGLVEENESYDIIEINVSNNDSFTLEIWGQVPNIYSVAIEIPGGEYIERIPPRFDRSERIRPIFGGGEIYVDYFLVEDSSGQELIMMRFFAPANGLWRIRVYSVGDTEKRYDAWLPITDFLSYETRFVRPSPDMTLTNPATAETVICVGAYNHVNGGIYLESSRGYTMDNRIKPDLVAPGVDVYGPGRFNDFIRTSGTSVAAAHAAGCASLMLQWARERGVQNYINGNQIRRYLIRGADRPGIVNGLLDVKAYPNREWGWGILDIYETFNIFRNV